MFTSIEILLIEDNPGDVRLIEEAFKEGNLVNPIKIVSNGEEALRFLRNEKGFETALRPDLVLLDLNLPKKDGLEVLEEMKADNNLQNIPVIILTTSNANQDILQSYSLHANCFITKPVDFSQFMEVVKGIRNFWVNIVTLPSND